MLDLVATHYEKLLVFIFVAEWCPHSVDLRGHLEALTKEDTHVIIVLIDIDEVDVSFYSLYLYSISRDKFLLTFFLHFLNLGVDPILQSLRGALILLLQDAPGDWCGGRRRHLQAANSHSKIQARQVRPNVIHASFIRDSD